ncbi:DUF397 domain-containing protein [Actinokineospora sp. NBRC 105648]|uniref:DUF397 domain-containing protein n=1 Tax=Actinokineospora sp. NBRC 105648 TaxID=3032206 RepID=UPI0024A06073|nr:DUF397 domain-containing protein [Actinokineospora sp. NBRC 105648]GLZ40222.1 hypothetical protein Acsp05_38460 [Actinokineospora sp. NBRC 105648]
MSGSLEGVVWRKSSRSSGAGGSGNTNDCVEVAFVGTVSLVRDSKGGPDGECLRLSPSGFAALVADLKHGR